MFGNSKVIDSNQQGVHDNLEQQVLRHQRLPSRRPVSGHTADAFEQVLHWLGDWCGPLILDSCCGVGESTARLAQRYPEHRVIGVDKSAQRIGKHSYYQSSHHNYCVIRADVNDFWRLLGATDWHIDKHYLLYPNPYPKSSQLQKRWHASAAMPDLMGLSEHLEVRSNWLIYLLEFAAAGKLYGRCSELLQIDGEAITPFERKYLGSGQHCWQLQVLPEEAE